VNRTGLLDCALDAVFPRRCFGCRAFGSYLCADCLADAPEAQGERRQPGVVVRSAFQYTGVARSAVLGLKFEGVSAAAGEMSVPMAELLHEWAPEVDAIVPVPLAWIRRRTRGYNQAELLARDIARAAGLPIEPRALRRARQTSPQAREPDREARIRNITGAFAPGTRPVTGSLLLIDDVTTTGATLDACARVLLGGGASRVYALTFARED
jgi:ComF family protein